MRASFEFLMFGGVLLVVFLLVLVTYKAIMHHCTRKIESFIYKWLDLYGSCKCYGTLVCNFVYFGRSRCFSVIQKGYLFFFLFK